MPVCTDLLTIGDGTVIRKDSFFTGYRAHDGVIQTGAVTLGKDALVGEATVLDIWTSLGDGAQLGHSSSLHAGQAVPAGERWHGSPAQRDRRRTTGGRRSAPAAPLRRVVYALVQLLNLLVLVRAAGVRRRATCCSPRSRSSARCSDPGPAPFTSWTFYRDALVASPRAVLRLHCSSAWS